MKVNNPLEVIYSDLAGPIDPIGKDGFKYFINFIDEYSGCTFYYCLNQRSDAVKAAEKFITDIAPYSKIKFIRTDNGGEYISEDFNSFLIQNKIKHNYTCSYSPHQNGTAERSWRALFDTARALMQLAVNYNLFVHQMDVKSGYLHASIDCDISVAQQKGYEVLNENGKPMVFH